MLANFSSIFSIWQPTSKETINLKKVPVQEAVSKTPTSTSVPAVASSQNNVNGKKRRLLKVVSNRYLDPNPKWPCLPRIRNFLDVTMTWREWNMLLPNMDLLIRQTKSDEITETIDSVRYTFLATLLLMGRKSVCVRSAWIRFNSYFFVSYLEKRYILLFFFHLIMIIQLCKWPKCFDLNILI